MSRVVSLRNRSIRRQRSLLRTCAGGDSSGSSAVDTGPADDLRRVSGTSADADGGDCEKKDANSRNTKDKRMVRKTYGSALLGARRG